MAEHNEFLTQLHWGFFSFILFFAMASIKKYRCTNTHSWIQDKRGKNKIKPLTTELSGEHISRAFGWKWDVLTNLFQNKTTEREFQKLRYMIQNSLGTAETCMSGGLELCSPVFAFHRCCFIVSRVLSAAWWACSHSTIYKNHPLKYEAMSKQDFENFQ